MDSLLPVYRRSELVISHGIGCYLFAEDGQKYLDFACGIAVNALGHCHPHVVQALQQQAATLWHCSNLYRTRGLERLAERYTELSFADKVFFCNSGSEAVECGLKMLRRFHWARGEAQKTDVITMQGGFHGRTLACISAGGNAIAREGFAPLLEGFTQVEFNNLQAVENAINSRTAAILVEPVQGEGGVRVAEPHFLRGLRQLCDQHGLLLMFDEVQCGLGRTGALFTHTQYGITPDILTLAKGIGNGFPLAACLATNSASSGMAPGTHGSTYGANPLAMAVGNAVLDVMLEPEFFTHVNEMAGLLRAGLEALAARYPALIQEVRGMGLMLGLKMHGDHRAFAADLRERGLLTVPTSEGGVVRVFPPLIVQKEQIDEALVILDNACQQGAAQA